MTRSKTRLTKAFEVGAERAAERRSSDIPRPPGGGAWSKSAVEEISERLKLIKEQSLGSVLDGSLPLRIPADQIEDAIGTDRVVSDTHGDDDETYPALRDNIKKRGLRVPIRVRPKDPLWRPAAADPHNVEGVQFILQSGRRRLLACRELGIVPLAFLSFVDSAEARLDDLKERFFENAARRNLRPYEKLLSIGLIAAEYPGETQDQISELIGVSRTMVSRSVAVLQFRAIIETKIDPEASGLAEIDALLSHIRKSRPAPSAEAERKRRERDKTLGKTAGDLPFTRRQMNDAVLSLKRLRQGRMRLTLDGSMLSAATVERIAAAIESILSDAGDTADKDKPS